MERIRSWCVSTVQLHEVSSKFILRLAKTNKNHLADVKDFTSTLAASWEKYGRFDI